MTPTPHSGSQGQGRGGKGRSGKPGAPKKDGPRGAQSQRGAQSSRGAQSTRGSQSPQGAKRAPKTAAFGRERFGQSLGPVKKNPPSRSQPVRDVHDPEGIRLQKLMAQAGVASRRVCEEMILEGRVEVDGQIITELGLRVDPKAAVVSWTASGCSSKRT